jgi:hypothetical protein
MKKFLELHPLLTDSKVINQDFLFEMNQLTDFHFQRSPEYRRILSSLKFDLHSESLEKIPFLPGNIFKGSTIVHSGASSNSKLLQSSGTTSTGRSRILIDKHTAILQNLALNRIVGSVIGSERLPLLIIDSKERLESSADFNARKAGIRGFSSFSSEIMYALDETGNPKLEDVRRFIKGNHKKKILMFGFTFIVWQNFIEKLIAAKINLGIERGFLFHGGGWKKSLEIGVSPKVFKSRSLDCIGKIEVINYYGMIEQAGSIYLECKEGMLHSSVFSRLIIRRAEDFLPTNFGEQGLVQTMSLIPRSYPGHSILTEDIGEIMGSDTCDCGWKGQYFRILGRARDVEIRGCSDV